MTNIYYVSAVIFLDQFFSAAQRGSLLLIRTRLAGVRLMNVLCMSCVCLVYVLCMSCEFLVYVLCMSCVCLVCVLCMSCVCLVNVL